MHHNEVQAIHNEQTGQFLITNKHTLYEATYMCADLLFYIATMQFTMTLAKRI
jgi:hypothetical protein